MNELLRFCSMFSRTKLTFRLQRWCVPWYLNCLKNIVPFIILSFETMNFWNFNLHWSFNFEASMQPQDVKERKGMYCLYIDTVQPSSCVTASPQQFHGVGKNKLKWIPRNLLTLLSQKRGPLLETTKENCWKKAPNLEAENQKGPWLNLQADQDFRVCFLT